MTNKNALSFYSKEIGIIETIIYKGKTLFAIYKNGEVKLEEEIEINDEKIKPINSDNNVISTGLLKISFKPKDYESNKDLYEEIVSFVKKYFKGDEQFIKISSIYVMMSWVFDLFREIPYLRVMGGFSTGKSRFLTTIGGCCFKAMLFTGSSSFSSIFRALDQFKGTLLFDEGDFKNSDFASEATKLFNVGYNKDGCITRSGERGNKAKYYELESFNVFGPKIIASRERYEDLALESRCISKELPVIKKSPDIILQIPKEFETEIKNIKKKLLMFRFENLLTLKPKSFDVDGINNMRILQIMAPIWTIAELLSDEERSLVIKYAKRMDREISRSQLITDEACVLLNIIKLIRSGSEKIYMLEISRSLRYVQPLHDGDTYADMVGDLSPRKIGFLVERNLHFKKHRDNRGLYLKVDGNLKKQVDNLKNRFGITDEMFK